MKERIENAESIEELLIISEELRNTNKLSNKYIELIRNKKLEILRQYKQRTQKY